MERRLEALEEALSQKLSDMERRHSEQTRQLRAEYQIMPAEQRKLYCVSKLGLSVVGDVAIDLTGNRILADLWGSRPKMTHAFPRFFAETNLRSPENVPHSRIIIHRE